MAVRKVMALDVANSILQRSFADKIDVNSMKLQRLLYREYYQKTGKALFNERFEMWRYGPVVPSVHLVFSENKVNAIHSYAKKGNKIYKADEQSTPVLAEVMDEIWSTYKLWSATALTEKLQNTDEALRRCYTEKKLYLEDSFIGI